MPSGSQPPTVVPCAVYGELHFLVLCPPAKAENDAGRQRVDLKVPTLSVEELMHYWEGDKIVFLSRADDVAGPPFGRKSFHKILLMMTKGMEEGAGVTGQVLGVDGGMQI